MGYWQRKFHLQHKLEDGNTWKGMINVEADTEEELPKAVKGTYWFSKTEEGWHGAFVLADGKADKRKITKVHEYEYGQYIYTHGVYMPHRNYGSINSMAIAEAVLAQTKNISYQYKEIKKYDCIIEDDIYDTETHYWEYSWEKQNGKM